MGWNSALLTRRPEREEQRVPDSDFGFELSDIEPGPGDEVRNLTDELEGVLGTDGNEEKLSSGHNKMYGVFSWGPMDWEECQARTKGGEEEDGRNHRCRMEETDHAVKKDSGGVGFWDDDDYGNKFCLKLNLNYEEVLDAWSDRGSLFADEFSHSTARKCYDYVGETAAMEEGRTRREGREASVLRYKEKRQNRLFSKKIRYQVRKLNADKRPRLKGRFVKRVC